MDTNKENIGSCSPLPCSLASLLTMNCRTRTEGIISRFYDKDSSLIQQEGDTLVDTNGEVHLATPQDHRNCSMSTDHYKVNSSSFDECRDIKKPRPIHVVTSEPILPSYTTNRLNKSPVKHDAGNDTDAEQDSDAFYDFGVLTPPEDYANPGPSHLVEYLHEETEKSERPESGCVTGVTSPNTRPDDYKIAPSNPPSPFDDNLPPEALNSRASEVNLEAVRQLLVSIDLTNTGINYIGRLKGNNISSLDRESSSDDIEQNFDLTEEEKQYNYSVFQPPIETFGNADKGKSSNLTRKKIKKSKKRSEPTSGSSSCSSTSSKSPDQNQSFHVNDRKNNKFSATNDGEISIKSHVVKGDIGRSSSLEQANIKTHTPTVFKTSYSLDKNTNQLSKYPIDMKIQKQLEQKSNEYDNLSFTDDINTSSNSESNPFLDSYVMKTHLTRDSQSSAANSQLDNQPINKSPVDIELGDKEIIHKIDNIIDILTSKTTHSEGITKDFNKFETFISNLDTNPALETVTNFTESKPICELSYQEGCQETATDISNNGKDCELCLQQIPFVAVDKSTLIDDKMNDLLTNDSLISSITSELEENFSMNEQKLQNVATSPVDLGTSNIRGHFKGERLSTEDIQKPGANNVSEKSSSSLNEKAEEVYSDLDIGSSINSSCFSEFKSDDICDSGFYNESFHSSSVKDRFFKDISDESTYFNPLLCSSISDSPTGEVEKDTTEAFDNPKEYHTNYISSEYLGNGDSINSLSGLSDGENTFQNLSPSIHSPNILTNTSLLVDLISETKESSSHATPSQENQKLLEQIYNDSCPIDTCASEEELISESNYKLNNELTIEKGNEIKSESGKLTKLYVEKSNTSDGYCIDIAYDSSMLSDACNSELTKNKDEESKESNATNNSNGTTNEIILAIDEPGALCLVQKCFDSATDDSNLVLNSNSDSCAETKNHKENSELVEEQNIESQEENNLANLKKDSFDADEEIETLPSEVDAQEEEESDEEIILQGKFKNVVSHYVERVASLSDDDCDGLDSSENPEQCIDYQEPTEDHLPEDISQNQEISGKDLSDELNRIQAPEIREPSDDPEERTSKERTAEDRSSEERSSEERDADSSDNQTRIKRSSSLRCGKTPPGTPGRKKIVRFADALGLDLAAIRTFLDGVPNVPPSAFCDLKVEEDAVADPSNTGFPSYSSYSKAASIAAAAVQNQANRFLTPMFQQPSGLPDFLDKLRSQKVILENITIGTDLSVKGIVRVINEDFHKRVFVRYTFDHWKNFHEATATYVDGSSDGFSDRFSFLLWGSFLQTNGSLVFCVKYCVKNKEYWDNNRGSNYVLQCYSALPYLPTGQNRAQNSGYVNQQKLQSSTEEKSQPKPKLQNNYNSFMDTPSTPTDPWVTNFF